MSLFLETLSRTAVAIAEFVWFPLLVWTVLAAVVLMILHWKQKIHVQYHYHIRLALFSALPIGLFITGVVDWATKLISTTESAAASLKFFVIQAPVEVTVPNPGTSTSFFSLDALYGVILLVILTVTIFLILKSLFQYFQLSLISRKLDLKPALELPALHRQNRELVESSGKPVYIAWLNRSVIPVTFGFRKPIVILPTALQQQTEKMNLVLRHELVHIRNRDYLTHLLMSGIRILFWFHPLVHMLYNQIIDYREMRCDSYVLADHSISRKEYASVLLELLPMPNLGKHLSVNMAQESSNLKKRIDMMHKTTIRNIPFKSSLLLFCSVMLAISLGMACTDLQHEQIFDEEELDLMTDVDRTGDRGYHQIMIYMGEEGQDEKHQTALDQLDQLRPEHIQSIEVIRGESAIEQFGPRAENGIILVKTRLDPKSYNYTLEVLGMEGEMPPPPPSASDANDQDEVFTVVEEMPELIGGLASIQENITYPEQARSAGIQGRVYIQFIVDEEGNVENPRVIRGIGGGADEAALEAVKQAQFKPGYQDGKPVKTQYSLPVVFRLPDAEQNDDS